MLNESRVLNYIKSNLGFPYVGVEMDDDVIINHIKQYTLREFSYYVPQPKNMSLNTTLESNQVPGRSNEYYLNEPEGLEILNVVDIIFPQSNLIMFGHPPIGPFTLSELREWALDVEVSMMIKHFSSWDYGFEFKHPNIVRISPTPNNETQLTVVYERMQPSDFRGIPNEFQILFCDFCLADIMIILGRIRKKYGGGNLRTPFGEIPLEGDVLDEGKEKKRELIEKLSMGPLMNIVVDFG